MCGTVALISTHPRPVLRSSPISVAPCLTHRFPLQSEIDMAATDKRCRVFHDDFRVEMFFSSPISKLTDNFREIAPPSFRVLERARKDVTSVSLAVSRFRHTPFSCEQACILRRVKGRAKKMMQTSVLSLHGAQRNSRKILLPLCADVCFRGHLHNFCNSHTFFHRSANWMPMCPKCLCIQPSRRSGTSLHRSSPNLSK